MGTRVDLKANGIIACGLEHVSFPSSIDLKVCSSGSEMRELARSASAKTIALVGCNIEDVSPLNLIAALHRDNPLLQAILVADGAGGAMKSNAGSAGAAAVMTYEELQGQFQTARRNSGSPLTISLMSGRGGVGKSTLSIALALSCMRLGLRVALIDADIQFSDLEFLCASDSLIDKAPINERGFDAALGLPQAGGKVLLAYPTLKAEYSDSANDMVRSVLEQMRGSVDVVFINTGSYWFDVHAQIADISDLCLMVMDQRASSIHGCKIAKDLCRRMGFASSKFAFVINRCSQKGKFNSYSCAISLGVSDVIAIDDGGEEVLEAFSLGMPSSLLGSSNAMMVSTSKALEVILARLGLDCSKHALTSVESSGAQSQRGVFKKWRHHVAVG